jgi:hypothetical protein
MHCRRRQTNILCLVGAGIGAIVSLAGCGKDGAPAGFLAMSGDSSDGGGAAAGNGGGLLGPSSGGASDGDAGVTCPPGLSCNVSCQAGATTTITGKVFDPAGKNPLYNVAVYVPAVPLQPLPRGVPTGADSCDCSALFKSGAIVTATTAVDGTFTLNDAPTGPSVPLVLQVGKWRRLVHVNVVACQANAQLDGSLTLPGTVASGDTDDNMPDIAVSTGSKDTLECLLLRMGLPASEYVAGASAAGHIHIFSGGESTGGGTETTPGAAESPAMAGAPASNTDLWATSAQLMPYDLTLLSCEGGETYDANPPALEEYLNAGGRVFASHYHYSWFSGPLSSGQSYSAPADWGTNLATWSSSDSSASGPIGGVIDTTLNGSSLPFPKGVVLQEWLGGVGALGLNGVPATELPIYSPRYNAVVTATNTPSQPWITSDASGLANQTIYFSFDTPVSLGAPADDGGEASYCGRAVFSDLHVGGSRTTKDKPPTPAGCVATDLSPQEEALEFMLFDLSSCVVPDTVAPPPVVTAPPR